MTEIVHDFRKPREVSYAAGNDTMHIPATGAAGWGDLMGDALSFALEADRRGCLLKRCYAILYPENETFPRSLWSSDDRELAEAIEAELGMEVRS